MHTEAVQLLSAIGFNVETVQVSHFLFWFSLVLHLISGVQYKSVKFQVWDLGGQSSIRYDEWQASLLLRIHQRS